MAAEVASTPLALRADGAGVSADPDAVVGAGAARLGTDTDTDVGVAKRSPPSSLMIKAAVGVTAAEGVVAGRLVTRLRAGVGVDAAATS